MFFFFFLDSPLLLQVLGSQSILHQGHAFPVRHFAKEAARPALKGDGEAKYAQLVRKRAMTFGLCLLHSCSYVFKESCMKYVENCIKNMYITAMKLHYWCINFSCAN